MKQTAVEWLKNEMAKKIIISDKFEKSTLDLFIEALEMEWQQIIDAVNSQRQLCWDEKGEQYYNETYKKP
jgi:hypothetical protein